MHRLVVVSLEQFVASSGGADAWARVRAEAGIADAPAGAHDDAQFAALVDAAGRALGVDRAALLEDFGRFLAPGLLRVREGLVDPAWRTLEVVAHTETCLHAAVRAEDPLARPPRLRAIASAPNEVRIAYASRRRLCGVAVGIVRGLADHFGERVEVTQPRCVGRGDTACEIVARRLPA